MKLGRRTFGIMGTFGVVAGATALLPRVSLAAEEPILTRVAFGSCIHQKKPQPIWDAVRLYRPELFVFAGDNVYGDVGSDKLTELKAAYQDAAVVGGLARLRSATRTLATWDDHDYGLNDAGGDFPHKEATKRLFLDFWQVPKDDPRRGREGVYTSAVLGPEGRRVQVILLDTRWFRSPLRPTDERGAPGKERYLPDPDPAKTLLGEAQWAWLEEELKRPAELRLLVSSIQVLAEGHGWERWGNLPLERQKLLDLIGRTQAGGVVILSGDRHMGALYRLAEGVPYPLWEITSSGINMTYPEVREEDGRRVTPAYGLENFGTVDVDWWAGEVRLSLRGMNGEPVRRQVVPLAELRPA